MAAYSCLLQCESRTESMNPKYRFHTLESVVDSAACTPHYITPCSAALTEVAVDGALVRLQLTVPS